MKKLWIALLSAALMFTTACGSSEKETSQSPIKEETVETAQTAPAETKTQEPASETAPAGSKTEKPVSQTAQKPAAVPGVHYTESSAFAGFDSYTTDYSGTASSNDFAGGEVILGTTLLKDYYKGRINEVELLDDLTHDDTKDVAMVEPHKAAKVETSYISMTGDICEYIVYNNTDAPAKPEECVIIGIENESSIRLTFGNGIVIYLSQSAVLKEDPAESIKAILDEPYEVDADDSVIEYTWRDQSNDHIFELDVYQSGDIWQIIEFSYRNFSFQN